jgi:PAS domain S-box-containing protein
MHILFRWASHHMNKRNFKSEEEGKILLNSLSNPAIIINQKGLFLMVNAEFEKRSRLNPKAIVGEPFLNLTGLDVESKVMILQNLSKRLQGIPVEPYEIRFTTSAGEVIVVEVKGNRINFAGQPADLVVFYDIT